MRPKLDLVNKVVIVYYSPEDAVLAEMESIAAGLPSWLG